jgi:16S rRNA (uracil1498-N3)-methyltransferase
MQRYFGRVGNGEAFLSEGDVHHLLDVMRSKVGEAIEIVDEGELYDAVVSSTNPLKITIKGLKKRETELQAKLLLSFSLLKHGNDDLVFEKGTELGVSDFYPFISSRTIIRVDSEEDKAKKLLREEKIVKGAAEQSKRERVPSVHPLLDYSALLDVSADLKLFAYENESDDVASLPEAFKALPEKGSCLIVIGPEGGFSPEEAQEAKAKGFRFVSLGKRILRAETAALYAASVFSYATESEGGQRK